jgi:uncharacterized protein (DUF58 family)
MQAALKLPHPLLHPLAHVRARFQLWWQARLPLSDVKTLTQRNVYILPTRAGFMLGATLLVLLVASINYQLNLGYLLTFLLAGSAVVGMHVCHGTLRGLSMSLVPPEPQFGGNHANVRVTLTSQRKTPRYGIGLSVLGAGQWVWCDVPAQGASTVELAFPTGRRGLHPVPTLTLETRFPLGTFRVWTIWRPAAKVLVYPQPESNPPPLPSGEPRAAGTVNAHASDSGEYDGVRPYRRGDPLKMIAWKKAAGRDELISRDSLQAQHFELWLDLAQTGGATLEHRLSRLCAWVLEAELLELDYGLRLNAVEIAPAHGELHRRRCLEALALC